MRIILVCVEVECLLTVDDKIEEIYYNDQALKIQQDSRRLSRWDLTKSIKFKSCNKNDPGKLKIKGYDNQDDGENCKTGGLMLLCTDESGGPWQRFKSDNVHWKDENGDKPCQNEGGFVAYAKKHFKRINFINLMRYWGAKKIWAPRQGVTLIGGPSP